MSINREGFRSILVASLAAIIAVALCFCWVSVVVGVLFVVAVALFFRDPKRELKHDDKAVFAPCDGKVVMVEKVTEDEFFGGRECIQVSIFMSIFNVHVNYFGVGGEVAYYKYHPGKFLVAWHPKSSKLNEHTTTVVRSAGGVEVLMRQIAGLVARRIVCYANVGDNVGQNSRLGFIKFGSRMDILLPPDSEILVKCGDRVRGSQTVVAMIR